MIVRQPTLFSTGPSSIDADATIHRVRLDDRCWVDHGPGWLFGADDLLDELVGRLGWEQRSRPMFDAMVAEPRLTVGVAAGDPALEEVAEGILATIHHELSLRYHEELGTLWCNWYRDGDDAVAWHGDKVGATQLDPLVAIVSLGGPRRLLLKPNGGGASTAFVLHSGDLLVMGGSTQHLWKHSVPRVRLAGPRISLTWRTREPLSSAAAPGSGG